MAVTNMFGFCPPPWPDPQRMNGSGLYDQSSARGLYGAAQAANVLGRKNSTEDYREHLARNVLMDNLADAKAKQAAAEREAQTDERLLLLENE